MSVIKPLLKLVIPLRFLCSLWINSWKQVSPGCNRHRDPKNKSVCMSMYVWIDVKPYMPFTMSDLVERGRLWILFKQKWWVVSWWRISHTVIVFHNSHAQKTRGKPMVVYNLAAVIWFSPLLWIPHSISPNNASRAFCRTTSTLAVVLRLLHCVIPRCVHSLTVSICKLLYWSWMSRDWRICFDCTCTAHLLAL